MGNVIIVGFTTEGSTDERFLESVIRRTFEDIAFECVSEIVVHDVLHIEGGGESFIEEVANASDLAEKSGVMVLCIHTDADSTNDNTAFEHKINPAIEFVKGRKGNLVELVPVVPVYMTEAWMLANTELLKSEIGTNMTDAELGLVRAAENVARPKELIKEVIRIATQDLPKRRRRLDISELYLPLGQKLNLAELDQLESYRKFKQSVRQSFINLNFLKG